MARRKHGPFNRLGFLDLHDHLGTTEHRCSVGCNRCASSLVVAVFGPDTKTCTTLHDHVVTMVRQLISARRREADSSFIWLDFGGYANDHDASAPAVLLVEIVGKTG